jgi:hypothetical protein
MSMDENIAIELNMLRERYPGKSEITYDEYADYFDIGRHHASAHFNKRKSEIAHKQIGRKVTIPLIDFAYYLAKQKFVSGKRVVLTPNDMKRKRGFCQ